MPELANSRSAATASTSMQPNRIPVEEQFGISSDEYKQKRSAFAFAAWVNDTFQRFSATPHFETQYFERVGNNIKPFLEEAVPLSRLALSLAVPGRSIDVACLLKDAYDAVIETTWPRSQSIPVEVTTTDSDSAALRRQALSRDGQVALTGPIRRDESGIRADGAMVDVGEEEDRQVALALRQLRRKAGPGRYPRDTAVLVYVTDCWLASLDGLRDKLRRETRAYLSRERPFISAVHFCYAADYSIDTVMVSQL